MRKITHILFAATIFILSFASCSEESIQGEWKCYDFTIEDTTGIPSVLIEEAVKNAKSTTLIFQKDSTYRQDYIVENSEIFSETGHYSIHENRLVLNPEKIGFKEISDPSDIEYKSIANNDFFSDITKVSNYQFQMEKDQLKLTDYIYGQSRNKTNKTTMSFSREK